MLPKNLSRFRSSVIGSCVLVTSAAPSAAQLLVDFNSTNQDGGPHNQAGYQAYDARHEVNADFANARNYAAFGASVSLLVEFPDTTDNRVRQMIDRGSGNDASYNGTKLDLVTDWIGIDSRTGSGGNGDAGVTSMRFTLSGLPSGSYQYRTFQHDTEFVNADFSVDLDDANGATAVGNFEMTASSAGGNVNDNRENPGAGNGPEALSSTVTFNLVSDGGPVTITYKLSGQGNVHNQLLGVNGFELSSTAPSDGPTDIALDHSIIARLANIGDTAGFLSTSDPTPGDTFTYTLVAGAGDSENGDFGITAGNRLIIERDLTVYNGGDMLSIRVRSTDAGGDFIEKVFLLTVVNDSDSDGLDDSWELSYFANLTLATGDGDNDGEGLTNLQEQSLGTNPTLADTDSDGLEDDVETDTGTFAGASDTGSDPLVADSDTDGINDGDEVTGANSFVTNPNLADTDGDGFSDSLEIAEGTNPTDNSDFPNTNLPLVINEILASNNLTNVDGDGNASDWIEIYNPDVDPVNLAGYYLSNDITDLNQWQFPSVTIPAGGYLVVFASNQKSPGYVDGNGNLHTDFSLNDLGEYLAIVRPDGMTVDDNFNPTFGKQFTDVSYGVHPTNGSLRFFSVPTPGAANNSSDYDGVVQDTSFDFNRGFYEVPFSLEITTLTPGATIRYTTDGTKPSETSGTIYTGPIAVNTTSNIRALAYQTGFLSTNVDTHTYIFVDDVAQQPGNPVGWPADWGFSSDAGAVVPADYEMDPRVFNNTIPGYGIREALLDIPTVSLNLPPNDFITPGSGMYALPQSRFERECSMEYIFPDGSDEFQLDCKVEVHGNASRRPARMNKHSLRLTFSSSVGPPKLRYPLFPDSPVETFNKLVLRACFTDSWGLVSWGASRYRPNDSQYFRDVWMKESLGAMGQPTSHGNFVHLYVNGLYFGLHNLTERIEDDFFAEHLGGAPEDWEINKDLSGGGSRWSALTGIDATTVAGYGQIQTYLDVDNFADYMLLHFYGDSEDWPHHNGYAATNAVSGDGLYRFFVWDQEIVLDKHNLANSRIGNGNGAGALFQKLRGSDEFRLLFADRAYKHMFNNGALSETNASARYLEISNRIDKAIVAESARWGDTSAKTPYGNTVQQPTPLTDINDDAYPPAPHDNENGNGKRDVYFTREESWLVERDNVINNYIPAIHDEANSFALINILRNRDLYPDVDPPAFSQHGGVVANNYSLTMSGTTGTIFYTTDGTDPRVPPAGVGDPPTVVFEEDASKSVYVPANASDGFSNGGKDWSDWDFSEVAGWTNGTAATGTGATGYATSVGDNYYNFITLNGPLDLREEMPGQRPCALVRIPFTLSAADIAEIGSLTLKLRFEDGMVAYINGTRVADTNEPAVLNGDSTATASRSDTIADDLASFDISSGVGALRLGTNVVAIHLLNQATGSSDLLCSAILESSANPAAGGGVSPTATQYTGPVILNQSGVIRARALDNGEWSPLADASFLVGVVPATDSNLVVSELHYNPAPHTAAEAAMGFCEASEFEFIELFNIGLSPVNLSGVRFAVGIEFAFEENTVLAAGNRLVLVNHEAAFLFRYGAKTDGDFIAGEYTSSFKNGGETVTLLAANDSVIKSFTYDDVSPWPAAADGTGPSLVLRYPFTNPDHNIASNWGVSADAHGCPGGDTALAGLSGNPDDDLDGDGVSALMEWALGTSDNDAGQGSGLVFGSIGSYTVGMATDDYLTIEFQKNLNALDVSFDVEVSSDLGIWNSGLGFTALVSEVDHGNGTAMAIYRSATPVANIEFIRLRVTQAP